VPRESLGNRGALREDKRSSLKSEYVRSVDNKNKEGDMNIPENVDDSLSTLSIVSSSDDTISRKRDDESHLEWQKRISRTEKQKRAAEKVAKNQYRAEKSESLSGEEIARRDARRREREEVERHRDRSKKQEHVGVRGYDATELSKRAMSKTGAASESIIGSENVKGMKLVDRPDDIVGLADVYEYGVQKRIAQKIKEKKMAADMDDFDTKRKLDAEIRSMRRDLKVKKESYTDSLRKKRMYGEQALLDELDRRREQSDPVAAYTVERLRSNVLRGHRDVLVKPHSTVRSAYVRQARVKRDDADQYITDMYGTKLRKRGTTARVGIVKLKKLHKKQAKTARADKKAAIEAEIEAGRVQYNRFVKHSEMIRKDKVGHKLVTLPSGQRRIRIQRVETDMPAWVRGKVRRRRR
jgi:hypothetical protein